jgi:hypothetical protein
MVMKHLTCLTRSLIVACMAAAIHPHGTTPAGKILLIGGNADHVREWNYFLKGVV